MHYHRATGRHYIHVFTDPDNRMDGMYTETREAWEKACVACPWMSVIRHSQYAAHPAWRNRHAVFVFWALPENSWPTDRECRVALVYVETLGPDELLNQYQKNALAAFEARLSEADAVIVQTPSMSLEATRRGWKTALCPTGAILPQPDWSAGKIFPMGYYGTIYGHREQVCHALQSAMGRSLFQLKMGGEQRKHALDSFIAVLTVLHCPGASYPTMRVWQSIASSVAHVSEKGDAWPAVPGLHYLSIPTIRPETVADTARMLKEFLSDLTTASTIARRAHRELSRYTPALCADGYLVPELERCFLK